MTQLMALCEARRGRRASLLVADLATIIHLDYTCTQKQESSGELDFSVTPRQDRSSQIHNYSATQVQESDCDYCDDSRFEDVKNSERNNKE